MGWVQTEKASVNEIIRQSIMSSKDVLNDALI